jgi:hypothetical protein
MTMSASADPSRCSSNVLLKAKARCGVPPPGFDRFQCVYRYCFKGFHTDDVSARRHEVPRNSNNTPDSRRNASLPKMLRRAPGPVNAGTPRLSPREAVRRRMVQAAEFAAHYSESPHRKRRHASSRSCCLRPLCRRPVPRPRRLPHPRRAGARSSTGAALFVTKQSGGDISVVDGRRARRSWPRSGGQAAAQDPLSPDGTLLFVALSGSPMAPPGVDRRRAATGGQEGRR